MVDPAFRPASHRWLANDVACLTQSLEEGGQPSDILLRRARMEKPDNR